ncbi:hypothetical protein SAMN05216302_101146 [Nitrosomonas aestuarii]|uniref:Uncharacterized protein n=1 Tax=Nitrosomonas aestuarii TaxID=52441 RepID=A0A1I4B859_9PROT|nr:hypothetical protein SAMN05216302_101146 [Nitrosomonas aestuarii]
MLEFRFRYDIFSGHKKNSCLLISWHTNSLSCGEIISTARHGGYLEINHRGVSK